MDDVPSEKNFYEEEEGMSRFERRESIGKINLFRIEPAARNLAAPDARLPAVIFASPRGCAERISAWATPPMRIANAKSVKKVYTFPDRMA
jgi:hypothetical protein